MVQSVLIMLAYNRLPRKGEKITRFYLDKLSVFVVYDNLDVGAVFEKHLSAISARRKDAILRFFVYRNDRIKLALTR